MTRRKLAAISGLAGIFMTWKAIWDVAVLFHDDWFLLGGFAHDPDPVFKTSLAWFSIGIAAMFIASLLEQTDTSEVDEERPEGMLR